MNIDLNSDPCMATKGQAFYGRICRDEGSRAADKEIADPEGSRSFPLPPVVARAEDDEEERPTDLCYSMT